MRRRSLQRFRTICCVWCPAGSIGVLSWTCPERDWAARGAATQKEGVPRGLESWRQIRHWKPALQSFQMMFG